jgi:hypothetical protein
MSKISFAKVGAASPAVKVEKEVINATVVEETSGASVDSVTTVAGSVVRTSNSTQGAVAPYQPRSTPIFRESEDDIPISDIILPTINIAQGVGDLGTIFEPGTLVYDKQITLLDPPERVENAKEPAVIVNAVVLGFRAVRYTEQVQGGGVGARCETLQEVYDLGGTTTWEERKAKPYFRRLDTALVLIEKPAHCEDASLFPYSAGAQRYGAALWNLQGQGYTNATKPIKSWQADKRFRDEGSSGNNSYSNRFIRLWVAFKKMTVEGQSRATYIPVVRLGGYTSPELREVARGFLDR